jgi:hypothetical protein
MTVRYRSRRADDVQLRARLRILAHVRRRFGYRRLHVLLRREGFIVNHKHPFRLYREERLMVRRRSGRKRALGTRAPMTIPQLPKMSDGQSTSPPISSSTGGGFASSFGRAIAPGQPVLKTDAA